MVEDMVEYERVKLSTLVHHQNLGELALLHCILLLERDNYRSRCDTDRYPDVRLKVVPSLFIKSLHTLEMNWSPGRS